MPKKYQLGQRKGNSNKIMAQPKTHWHELFNFNNSNLFRLNILYAISVTELAINKYRCIEVERILMFKHKNLESPPFYPSSSPSSKNQSLYSRRFFFKLASKVFASTVITSKVNKIKRYWGIEKMEFQKW